MNVNGTVMWAVVLLKCVQTIIWVLSMKTAVF